MNDSEAYEKLREFKQNNPHFWTLLCRRLSDKSDDPFGYIDETKVLLTDESMLELRSKDQQVLQELLSFYGDWKNNAMRLIKEYNEIETGR